MELVKGLENMTLDELWTLFPIVLTPHQPYWEQWAKDEIGTLSGLLSAYSPVINHIGSTAIPAIRAKPIIDILVEISPDLDWSVLGSTMERSGYICMAASGSRLSFNKGYTPRGYAEKVFHIHIHAIGDNDEICFRDYLRSNPATALEYESLKLSLLPEYTHNRNGYTMAKTEFVKKILESARQTARAQEKQTHH